MRHMLTNIPVAVRIFCLGDQEEVLSNPLQTPFLIVFNNSTKSKGAAVALTVPIIICFMSALINEVATASRQLWSFARDGGFPFAAYLDNVRHLHKLGAYLLTWSRYMTLKCLAGLYALSSAWPWHFAW